MKGLALMLKALYPNLDWSTPEKTMESLLPGLNVAELRAKFEEIQGIAITFAAAAVNMDARQSRLESMMEELLQHARRTDRDSYTGRTIDGTATGADTRAGNSRGTELAAASSNRGE